MCLWISLCCCRLEIKDVAAFVSSRFALNVSLLPALIFSREKKTGPQKSSRRVYLLSQRERERTAEEIEASHVTRPPIIRSKKHLFYFFLFFLAAPSSLSGESPVRVQERLYLFLLENCSSRRARHSFHLPDEGKRKKKEIFLFFGWQRRSTHTGTLVRVWPTNGNVGPMWRDPLDRCAYTHGLTQSVSLTPGE